MKNVIRNGALALGLIAGVALVAAPPASAGSIQRDGYFGGTWKPIGPRHNRYVQRHNRRNYGPDVYAYSGPRPITVPAITGRAAITAPTTIMARVITAMAAAAASGSASAFS